MAQVKALKFAAPKFTPVNGVASFINDKANITANPAASDTIDFILPKGLELSYLKFYHTDMDSATGLAGSIGFAPITGTTVTANGVAGTAANTTYFRAAGAIGQTATGFECDFIPVVFEEDVYIRITITVTATGFSAGTIYCTIGAANVGVK